MSDGPSPRLQLVATGDFIAKVDKWRRKQPDNPNRSEAIRRLVDIALSKPKG